MISVIIPTYNRAKTIMRSINSVLNQTYNDIEVLIIDDGSTDETKDVIKNIDDDRIRYIKQENSGACVARNHGISIAKGEYIAFHDSDDEWHLDKLEKQLKIMEKNNASIVCCKMIGAKRNGGKKYYPCHLKNGFINGNINLFGIGTQTLLAKKEVFEKNKFDPEMPRYQDFELLLRIIQNYNIYYIDEALVNYNIGDDSISVNPVKLEKACEMILKKHPNFIKEYPLMAKTMACNLLTGASIARKTNKELYNKIMKESIEINKSPKTILKYFLIKSGIYK